ncbi:MAG: helix-turn-helix domain-containing protein [Clostridia bacterium]|nr:helix-turn-helix domain-containing protein [Clostridia bacterium]
MLGERIKELRKKHKMSRKELAAKLGVSISAIGMYEQENREPDHAKLEKLCEIFNVTLDYLMGRKTMQRTLPQSNDIIETFDLMAADILEHGGLMFNGEPIDNSEVERVVEAMRLGMILRLQQDINKK